MSTKVYHKANAIENGKVLAVILGATAVSLAFMFVFIMLELPMFLTIALFLGVMLLSIFSFVYKGEYWISENQLEEKLTPKLKFMPFLKLKHNYYNWNDLDKYLLDSNMTRYSGEQRYLKLTFKNPKRVVNVSEGNELATKETFAVFADAFTKLLEGDTTAFGTQNTSEEISTPAQTVSSTTTENKTINQPPIKAKAEKSFYEGIWGKILAVFFLILSGAFLAINFFPNAFGGIELSGTNKWKLWAIVVPGTIYLVNRAFFSKRKQQ